MTSMSILPSRFPEFRSLIFLLLLSFSLIESFYRVYSSLLLSSRMKLAWVIKMYANSIRRDFGHLFCMVSKLLAHLFIPSPSQLYQKNPWTCIIHFLPWGFSATSWGMFGNLLSSSAKQNLSVRAALAPRRATLHSGTLSWGTLCDCSENPWQNWVHSQMKK